MMRRAFWFMIFGFIAGIVCGLIIGSGWWWVIWLWCLSVTVLCIGVYDNGRVISIWCAIGLIAMGVGIARVQISPLITSNQVHLALGQTVRIKGIVVSEPDQREHSVLLTVNPSTIHYSDDEAAGVDTWGRILVSVRSPAAFSYGDRIVAKGTVELPSSFETGEGHIFNYPKFLAVRRIGYVMHFAEVEKVGAGEGNVFLSKLFAIKKWYLQGLGAALVEPHAGLAGGITVGDKRAMGEELSESFQTVGLSHVVVLSGYNITVVVSTAMRLIQNFAPPPVTSMSGVGVIIVFVLMSGASGAAVRAGIMAVVVLVARMTRRPYAAPRALAIAAVGMLLYEPLFLLYDPGFQLSIIATLGLIYLSPLIKKRLVMIPEKMELRGVVSDTIGTQIAVLPLLVYQTGLISLISFPVNIIVLPVVPFAMVFSAIAGVIGGLLPTVAFVFGMPAYMLLSYVFFVVEWGAQFPFAAITVSALPLWVMLMSYGALCLVVWYFRSVRM